jgi:YegS/Rv2252/BmrU family lipid kinase
MQFNNIHNKDRNTIIGFIINPVSGNSNKYNYEDKIISYFANTNIEPIIEFTKKAGDAVSFAKKAIESKLDAVVVAGGDGTVNEVVNGLGLSKIPMGIIPSGSGNGLARHLGISLNFKKSLEVIKQGFYQGADLIKINDKLSINVSGVGFDALVSHKFQNIDRRGLVSYVKIIAAEFASYKSQHYKLEIDGKEIEREAFLISLANSSQFGNNAFISPKASVSNGYIDVCIVKPFPKIASIIILEKLMTKSLDRGDYLEIIKAKNITIKQESDIYHIDGDAYSGSKELDISVLPSEINIIIPKYKVNNI